MDSFNKHHKSKCVWLSTCLATRIITRNTTCRQWLFGKPFQFYCNRTQTHSLPDNMVRHFVVVSMCSRSIGRRFCFLLSDSKSIQSLSDTTLMCLSHKMSNLPFDANGWSKLQWMLPLQSSVQRLANVWVKLLLSVCGVVLKRSFFPQSEGEELGYMKHE